MQHVVARPAPSLSKQLAYDIVKSGAPGDGDWDFVYAGAHHITSHYLLAARVTKHVELPWGVTRLQVLCSLIAQLLGQGSVPPCGGRTLIDAHCALLQTKGYQYQHVDVSIPCSHQLPPCAGIRFDLGPGSPPEVAAAALAALQGFPPHRFAEALAPLPADSGAFSKMLQLRWILTLSKWETHPHQAYPSF